MGDLEAYFGYGVVFDTTKPRPAYRESEDTDPDWTEMYVYYPKYDAWLHHHPTQWREAQFVGLVYDFARELSRDAPRDAVIADALHLSVTYGTRRALERMAEAYGLDPPSWQAHICP